MANAPDLTASQRLRLLRTIPAELGNVLSEDVLTIAPDGSVLTSIHGDRLTPTGAEPVAGIVKLVAPDGTATTLPEPPNDPLLKAADADADDSTIVWLENAADNFDSGAWRYLAYDRGRGSTTVIAGDGDFRPRGDVGYSSGPMLAGGRVYWSVSYPDPENPYGQSNRLYSRDVAGLGSIVRVLDNVRNVSLSGDTLCYGRDDGLYYPSRWITLHRRDLHTGVDQVVTRVTLGPDMEFGGLSCGAASVAWVVDDSHGNGSLDSRLVLRDEHGRETTIGGGYFVAPTVTPAFLLWYSADTDGQVWAYDHAGGIAGGILGDSDVSGRRVVAAGRHLAWHTANGWQVAEVIAP